ncbi:kelch domain-containing protein 1 [Pteropus vampyrus]|uniref:Kelch domain-containing protein 1 n=1 Tax=Pteropus vampyrus TaxID=132908 RepID=A0A6P3R4Z5_PTEVA|nr:kelch domain-containing protein 1 [Pteropus vampyrus]
MEDSQLFCVAEERSGHCAVVDGNFLYVWGGYVVRGRGGTGPTRVGSPPGFSDRADAESPPTPSPEAGAGPRPRLSATRPSLRCRPLFQPCKGLTPPRGCSHYESLPTLCGVSSLQSPPPPQLFSNPSLPNTKSVTARLSSLNACGDLKVHRGRRACFCSIGYHYIVIVSDNFHLKRAHGVQREFKFAFLDSYEIPCRSCCRTMHLMEGELPTSMSGSCGACINGKLYVFGGYDDKGYSNRLYFVNLRTRDGNYIWEKITNFEGKPPTPRDKLSCWVYKDRLIYFGGYGCRRHNELQDCFDVHDASWEEQIFWGWHNDVHVFDTKTQSWFQPEIKGGVPPQPRAAHTCAVLGNKGYIFGGRVLQTRMNDLHYLNLDTWTWSGRVLINGENPKHRSWHTLTPIADDKLFLFGGLSADNIPLSDGWIHNVITNCWKQLTHLPKTRPRLWHTACLGKENEIMVFGGSKDDLLSLDTGHCNDLLIFQTQPYSLLRSCLDCIGKNAIILESQISLLPPKLLQQVLKKITFWTAANHREEQRAQKEETENKCQRISSN